MVVARHAQLCLGAASLCAALRARQGFMDLVAGALIVVDTTWIQAAILAHATSAQYTLVRAIVLASRAGRLARLMRHLNLLQVLHARPAPAARIGGLPPRALQRSGGLLLTCQPACTAPQSNEFARLYECAKTFRRAQLVP